MMKCPRLPNGGPFHPRTQLPPSILDGQSSFSPKRYYDFIVQMQLRVPSNHSSSKKYREINTPGQEEINKIVSIILTPNSPKFWIFFWPSSPTPRFQLR